MPVKKLLIADDSPTIQKTIGMILNNEGYEIRTVSDGNHALQQIATFQPDVVLIDVALPRKSAFEVKREVNQSFGSEKVKFILMSSAFEQVDETQVKEVSFHARLTKPLDPPQLRKAVAEVIHSQQRPFSTQTQRPDRMQDTNYLQPSMDTITEFPPLPSLSSHEELEQPQLPPLPGSRTNTDPFAGFEIREHLADQPLPPSEDQDLPPLPSIPIDSITQLWENPASTPPAFSDTVSSEPPPLPESDIKRLADITLNTSVSPDFEWSINQTLPQFDFSTEESAPPSLEAEKPEITHPPTPELSLALELPPLPEEIEIQRTGELKRPPATPPHPQRPAIPENKATPDINLEEIETIIRKQVHETLEKMAKGMLPSIAERIIKEEIHRLLTEPEAPPPA